MKYILIGDTNMLAGDYLIVLSNEDEAADIRESLSEAGESVRFPDINV